MSFFKNKTRAFMVCASIILIIFMAISTIPSEKAGIVGNIFGIIISPVQSVVGKTIDICEDAFNYVFRIKKLNETNSKLKEQISVLNADVRELTDLKNENDRLRALLDLRDNMSGSNLVACEIISRDINNWYSIFTVNKGTKDGLKINFPVITNDGLVGYIYEIGYTWAKVKTIIDPTSSVSAFSKRTGDGGIADGTVELKNSMLLKMSYIPLSSALIEGDTVESSGEGGIYPTGLYIGRIKEIKKAPDGLSMEAIVEPGVSFDDISAVMVICSSE